MTKKQYVTGLRIVSIFVGILFALVSLLFSVDGFNFQIEDRSWMGFVLGFGIIIIELVWNQQGMSSKNLTLMFGGMLAYFYGIATNVLGIAIQQGALTDEWWRYVLPVIMGLFLEIMPEPLILWGLLGSGDSANDVVGSFVKGLTTSGNGMMQSRQKSRGLTKPSTSSQKFNPTGNRPTPKFNNSSPISRPPTTTSLFKPNYENKTASDLLSQLDNTKK